MWKACVLLVGLCAVAHADDDPAAGLARHAAFTPGMLRATGGQSFVTAATSWSGASDRVRLDASGEAELYGPLRLVVHVADAFRESARPGIGAAVQLVDEAHHGVAGTAYVQYKAEGFSEPEGELEAVLAFGKRLGRVQATVDLAYGQDPEGNERDGELALAAQIEPLPGLFTGATARYRDALASTKEPIARDAFAGATSTFAVRSIAVSAMFGIAMIETDQRRYGAAATLAVGAVF